MDAPAYLTVPRRGRRRPGRSRRRPARPPGAHLPGVDGRRPGSAISAACTPGWARWSAAGGERVGPRETPTPPEDGPALLAWYRAGLADLVAALSVDAGDTGMDILCDRPQHGGLVVPAPGPGDGRAPMGRPGRRNGRGGGGGNGRGGRPIAAELAVEGVDELLVEFLPGILAGRPVDELTGTLHLHATDTTGEWWLDLGAEGLAPRREHAKADTAVRGPASGLYLWLWNRQTPEEAGLEVFGRTETVAAWPSVRM